MNKKHRLAGRFLPFRVYTRWKWTVRCCLLVIPSILFLTGGLVFFLTPVRYQSAVVFEYLGKRPLPEVEALLKSGNVVGRAVSATDMVSRLQVDKGMAVEIVSENLETSLNPASGMIELKVTNTRADIARDLAAELPKSLEAYESDLAKQELEARYLALRKSQRDADDFQEEMRKTLVQFIRVNGDPPVNALAGLNIAAARRDWENAQNQRLEAEARSKAVAFELENPDKWVLIHSHPEMSSKSIGKRADESLGRVILQALAAGLGLALTVPYLLELAFPRRRRSRPVGHELAFEEVDFIESPARQAG